MYQVEAANRLLGQCKLVFASDTELNSPVILHDTQSWMQANNAHYVPLVRVFFSINPSLGRVATGAQQRLQMS